MTLDELKSKAAALPLEPGVYIMRDKDNTVIYVGKAKKLKNRVSQYFQDTAAHSPKTRLMVSKIDHFDVFVASSEFEALVLECAQIKQYMPKYNILLKDDKGYPYLRLNMKEPYPVITIANRIMNDGASYYGPFGSRGVTNSILEIIHRTLKLPDCSRRFPEDIGKDRPCLNYHMNQCSGWCQGKPDQFEYRSRLEQARQLLLGNYKQVAADIKSKMEQAAESLNFELAASLRDQLNAVNALGLKQLVATSASSDVDAIGYGQTESKACFAVLHFKDGALIDKEYEIFSLPDDKETAVSSLLKQYYLSKGFAPKTILLPFEVDDSELFSQFLSEKYGHKTQIRRPQRGDSVHLMELACKNAFEEVQRITTREERHHGTLQLLCKMLGLNSVDRIESYDISNISGTDIVASMVVFRGGKPYKSDYKRFKLDNLENQDDYASMYQVLERRFIHYLQNDAGFSEAPQLLLIDGGTVHASVAKKCLASLGLSFPVFGMVKDNRHRTRALVTASGQEIRIDNQQSIFSLIGNIQEETHRFAITYHRKLRSKRLRYSQLDQIPGIGPKRKQLLLKAYSSIKAISGASAEELARLLPETVAREVYDHFHKKE